MDIKQEQIEKMNLEVKEKLNLTDKEYEKSKDVLTRLNEMDLEVNPELYENKQEKNQTENQKKIKELEERKKQAEKEEQLLIESFSQEIGQSVKDTEKIWGYLKRYTLIGMVTGVPGIALTCLYDKWKENAMAKELKELNQKVIASQNEPELHKELAEKYGVSVMVMTGFLDGINDSLKEANPIEEMEEDTEVNLGFEPALLYKNMVAANADWLYNLEEWNDIFDEDTRKALYKEQKSSTTIVKDAKVYPNDPCPCGSGKKYKKCCGRN